MPTRARRGLERAQFDAARDEARGPRDRDRRGRGNGARDARCRVTLDCREERQGFGIGPRADLILQQMLATIERQQCGATIAGEVMQPHQAPMHRLGQRFKREQVLRIRQRRGPFARAFGIVGPLFERAAHTAAPTCALRSQPLAELAADSQRHRGQHAVTGVEVVSDAGCERQRVVAGHQIGVELLAQLEQALTQRVARRGGAAVGPQQVRQPRARRRALEREPGEHCGVAVGQRKRRVRAGQQHGGSAGELQPDVHVNGRTAVIALQYGGSADRRQSMRLSWRDRSSA